MHPIRAAVRLLAAGSARYSSSVNGRHTIGCSYPLSKGTTVYVDLVHEGRDNLPADRRSVAWDLDIRHNF